GAASDSPASPPTAATGTTARAVTRASADGRRDAARPSGAARRAVLRENPVNYAPLTMADARTGGAPAHVLCARSARPGDKAVARTRTVIPHDRTEVDSYPVIWLVHQVSTCAGMSHLFRTCRYLSGGHCRRGVTNRHAARSELMRPRE